MIDRFSACALAGVLFLLSPGAAAQAALPNSIVKAGPDFTISVPIALHDLDPRVNRFRVACVITDAAKKTLQQADAKLSSTGVITMLNGLHEFSGTVAYGTNLALPAQRPLAAAYVCEMRLLTATDYDGGGVIPMPCSPADLAGAQSYKCVKTGAPLRPQIFGPLSAAP